MAGTTIQKELVYDGTRQSAIQVIFSRTFGSISVQFSLVLLVVLWTIPTAGLLISSVRTPNAIQTSGWWTMLEGPGQVNDTREFTVFEPGQGEQSRLEVASGETLIVTADESRLLRDAPAGVPAASINTFGVTSVAGDLTVEAFGEPIGFPEVGTIVVEEDGTVDFTPEADFVERGVFAITSDIEADIEPPFEISYVLEGLGRVEGTFVVDMIEDDVEIEAYSEPVEIRGVGTVVVSEDGTYEFTPDEDYQGDFELDVLDDAELPYETVYRIEPYGERLNLGVAFAFLDREGNLEVEPRGTTEEVEATIEGDPLELPVEINYTAIRRGGRFVTSDASEPLVVPGVGALTIDSDGAYSFTPLTTFDGTVDLVYTIRNPFITLDNYEFVLTEDQMDVSFLNSLTVAIPATIIPIAIAAFAAYAFAWMEFPGRRWLFITVVGLMVVPLQVAFIPLLRVYTDLDLNGTFVGLWLAHTGFGMPLAVFLLRNYIANLPRELIESAAIDGASHFTIFLRLVLPLSVPALASFAIFQFLWVWNDLLVALVFLGDTPVVTSRLSEMVGSRGQDWFVLTAGAFITMIIPLIVFFSLQRYFVRGLLAGSIKGG